jgi:hypothetical protein
MSLEQEYRRKQVSLEIGIAQAALAANDLATAERHYTRARALDAGNAQARAGLIQLWVQQGQRAERASRPDAARRFYRKVLKLDAQNITARARLGMLQGTKSAARLWAMGLALALLLVGVVLGGLWGAGAVQIPAFVCDAAGGLCTPAPTLSPTPTIQPTYTPFPTPTPVPLTPTYTPSPTPTPTATPLPYAEWLEGCEADDYTIALTQVSPVEQSKTRNAAGPLEGLKTTFVLTNTGKCLLIEGVLDVPDGEIAPDLPARLNPGQTATLNYTWPTLAEGRYTATLTLKYTNISGTVSTFESPEFVLVVDLSIIIDRDGDGIPDDRDACPGTPGLERFNGCPDTDKDGVEDREDCCPKIAGLADLNGCPDTDKDGFPDSNADACPALPQVDCCPNTPGTVRGCPDTDGDGFPDNQGVCTDLIADQCPEKLCAESANGCPACHREYDRCPVEVCEDKTDPATGETIKECHAEYQDCNPHEVCTCP